ncbi:hypothetical protein F4776DRAFT_605037 [Hypoxylon sp. NC0597]|nr:hypothetical protein F4776DRAFT_605037 [Hypoxylon sp. NC0597]
MSTSHEFCLIAPRARKFMIGGRSFDQAMFTDLPHELVRLLATPLRAHERQHPFSFSATGNSSHANKSAEANASSSKALMNLSQEIQLMIFGQLENVEDCIALGLTNKYFFALSLPVMHNKLASQMGIWAGTNILYCGNDAQHGDYPPGLFSAEEERLKNLETVQVVDPHVSDIGDPEPLRLSHYGTTALGEAQVPYTCDMWKHFCRCQDRSKEGNNAELWSIVEQSFEEDFNTTDFYPQDQHWVLRNLTTKEFVRDDSIALGPEFIRGPAILGIGFGHALMARICWSPSNSTTKRYPSNITRGVWAGHRFEITTLAKHVEATKGEVWVDVGVQVAGEIAHIWGSKYGSDWRKDVVWNISPDQGAMLHPNRAWYTSQLP